MPNEKQASATRRDFIAGAAGLLGAAVIGAAPTAALAQTKGAGLNPEPPMAPGRLYFVDGNRLVDAASLPSGDPGLDYVRVRVHAIGEFKGKAELEAITAPGVSFQVWRSGPETDSLVQFHATVGKDSPLKLRTAYGVAAMTTGAGPGPKLKAGSYVLLNDTATPDRHVFDAQQRTAPLLSVDGQPAPTAYLWLTVSEA